MRGIAQSGKTAMTTLRNLLSVTIAFFLGGGLVSMVFYVLVQLGFLTEPGYRVDDWLALGMAIASFAALSGLIVDAMRFLATVVWRGKPPYRLKLRKILREHLA